MERENQNKRFYAIQRYENSADIHIFSDISDEQWWGDEVTPNSIVNELKNLQAETINVHINSYGGSVSAGWAIYQALRAHGAHINTYADGFVCSAALYPFLAGDVRHAQSTSAFYLHEVSTGAWGYAEDLRKAAEEAEKLTEIGINAFIERAGMDAETVKDLMSKETWLSPKEAADYGIATDVISAAESGASQSALAAIIQKVMHPAEERIPEAPKALAPEMPEQKEKKPENSLMKTLSGILNVKSY